jgi:hypothetical protein
MKRLLAIILILVVAFTLSAFSDAYVARWQAFIGYAVVGLLLVFGVGSASDREGPLARIRREHPDDEARQ